MSRAGVRVRRRDPLELADLALAYAFHLCPEVYARLFAATLLPAWVLLVVVSARWNLPPYTMWLAAIAWGTLARGVFTVAAARAMFDPRPRAGSIGWQFAKKVPALVAALVAATTAFLVLLPTGIAAAYVAARGQLTVEAVALENTPPLLAIRRSFAMTRGRVASAFLTSTLALFLQGAFALSIALSIHGVRVYVLMLPPPSHGPFDLEQSLSAILGYFVSLPFVSTYRFLSYVDGRARSDGWDLQLRFRAITTAREGTPNGA